MTHRTIIGGSVQDGSVLIFTLLLMAIVLMSAIGIMSTTIIEQNIASVADDSTVAFQTADAGAEQALHEFRKDRIDRLNAFDPGQCSGGRVTRTNVNGISGAQYAISFYDENGNRVTRCSDRTISIRSARSVGQYGKAIRSVEFAVSVPTDDIASGLVARWTFDSNMRDSVGSHNGTAHGNATTTSSGVAVGSGALNLDGSGGYVQIGKSGDFNFTHADDYTISFWIFPTTASNDHTALYKDHGYYLRTEGRQWNYRGLTPSTTDVSVAANQWQHVVLWQSGTMGSRALYINGKPFDDGGVVAIDASDSKDLFVGIENVGVLKNAFRGMIDDLRIYDRALTQEEIIILCKNEFAGESTPSGVTCGG